MILTLIGVFLVILGIVVCSIWDRVMIYNDTLDDCMGLIGMVSLALGLVISTISIILVIKCHIGVQYSIDQAKLRYDSLVKQVEIINSDYEDVSKTQVIQKVMEWNQDVYSTKYWSDNPMTSWFWSQEYADSLEYIELEE